MKMNETQDNGQGIKDAATQGTADKEQKRTERRPAIGAKAQTILSFLRKCTPYEADSIRVMVNYATGKGEVGSIEATDLLAVNRFLNYGMTKENTGGVEAVITHRQTRAQKLIETVKEFVDIGQLCRVSIALMRITSDAKAVEEITKRMQPSSPQSLNKA